MAPRGFTLVELLVTISITVVLAILAMSALGNLVPDSQLTLETDAVVSMLRSAQSKTLSGEEGGVWGVYLTSTEATLFLGSSYASRQSAYDQVQDFSEPMSVSGIMEVVFEKRSGKAASSGSILLSSDITNESRSITINTQGRISY
jgi:prepilin-type N-terminal cleavage/methylation domain-containing protein